MAKKRVAINGFGRIGRLTFRNLMNDRNIEVVAVNDLTDNATLAHLLKHDSAHGILDANVSSDDDSIKVGRKSIVALSQRDPAKLPWKKLKIDVVVECTGFFRTKDAMSLHLKAGAKKVVLSAPAKGEGVKTVVLGVNDDILTKKDKLVSNASCTTNCLAPMLKIVDENWGLVTGTMTTTHAYTSDQKLQDAPHSDKRRARAAAYNIIPTSTGAANAVGKVLPNVAGKIFAMAIRVPVITGSLVELTVETEKDVTVEKINKTFKKYASKQLKGILEYSEAPLVSSDIVRNPHSSIFDSGLTLKNGKLIKIVCWYDNEAGFSARLADLVRRV